MGALLYDTSVHVSYAQSGRDVVTPTFPKFGFIKPGWFDG
jgi:hypothetical protein